MQYLLGLMLCLLLTGNAYANEKTIELNDFCPHHKDAIVCGGDMAVETDVKINRCGDFYTFEEYAEKFPPYFKERELLKNPEYCPC